MREIRPYGSVRGVRRKPYPYRDTLNPMPQAALFLGRPSRHGTPALMADPTKSPRRKASL